MWAGCVFPGVVEAVALTVLGDVSGVDGAFSSLLVGVVT